MSADSYLFLTTCTTSDLRLVDLAETAARFLVEQMEWTSSLHGGGQPYRFVSMRNDLRPRGKSERLDREDPVHAQQQIESADPRVARIQLSGKWFNPYMTNQPAIRTWAMYLDVGKLQADDRLFQIAVEMAYANRWYCLPHHCREYYEEDDAVRQLQAEGYELNKGDRINPIYGQEYVAQENILQQNRLKVLEGAIAWLKAFDPPALVLAYDLPVYDAHKGHVSLGRLPAVAPPLFYGTPALTVTPKTLKAAQWEYFRRTFDGVVVSLEREHYGFLA